MTVACYFCHADVPSNQAKRCSRCRLVTYCSKECQTLSWKASHKVNCSPNLFAAALDGAKPARLSTEWLQLEIDKLLGKWMADWRRCFMEWTILALDLANHPPNRPVTHCLHMIVEPRLFQTKSYQKLRVVRAAVVPFSYIQKTYPKLVTKIDTTDFTRFRYAITLQSPDGDLCRVRLLQWSVRDAASLALWNELPKDKSALLAGCVVPVLMSSVGDKAPDVVEQELGLGRRR